MSFKGTKERWSNDLPIKKDQLSAICHLFLNTEQITIPLILHQGTSESHFILSLHLKSNEPRSSTRTVAVSLATATAKLNCSPRRSGLDGRLLLELRLN